ncbi:MAG: hypothetical protein EAZ55_08790 [Cytophagales bacterium]|nr:MAG: hypothetical protein EAZ55_08790 [Cytophagales bacterium]
MNLYQKVYTYFIPQQYNHQTDDYDIKIKEIQEKYKLIINFSWVTSLFSLFYIGIAYIIAFFESLLIMPIAAIVFFLLPFLLKTPLPKRIIINLYITCTWIAACFLSYYSGGINSGVFPWLVLLPIIAKLLSTHIDTIIWLTIACISTIFFGFLGTLPADFDPKWQLIFVTNDYLGLIIIVWWLITIFDNAKFNAKQQLKREYRYITNINQKLHEKQQEILTQNEELHQQQEEIMSQRDFIEKKNEELSKVNRKMKANEEVLRKYLGTLEAQKKEILEQKSALEARDRQISSSINAALTIQQALLPDSEKINSFLNDYFIIYQPKDIVSGDFYWINQNQNITQKILVIADCTGHGVPGAFMTLIASVLLDKIINVWRIDDPAKIFQYLHTELKSILKQEKTNNNNGLDAVVIAWRETEGSVQLEFAGAKNDLYYNEPTQNKIQKLKGTRRSIGGFQNESILFETQKITLPKDTMLYIGSDGLADQNNFRRKKLGEITIIETLEKIKSHPLSEQKETLLNLLQTHMQGTAQRDDILWIGLRL